MTRGRGLELERELRALERRMDERLQAAEARADAASQRADELLTLFNRLVANRPARRTA